MTVDPRLILALEEQIARNRGSLGFTCRADEVYTTYQQVHPGAKASECPDIVAKQTNLLEQAFAVKDWLVVYRKFSARFQCQKVPSSGLLERLIDVSNQALRQEMRNRLYQMDGLQFEQMVIKVLRQQTWVQKIEGTKQSHDAGIDFVLTYANEPFAGLLALGQVKRKKDKVGGPEMRNFIGSIQSDDRPISRGIYVAYAGFNDEAARLAEKNQPNIQLRDVDAIIDWLLEAQVGVSKLDASVYRLEEAFWREAGVNVTPS
jgi:restriction endonuclease Mrr